LVLAGQRYGIPMFGTMAHSYIQAHDDEAAAFAAFVQLYPDTTLLVDTYDTLGGVEKVIDLARRLGDTIRVHAIRLDSGDLAALARQARQRLDRAGLSRVQIFASSELDEHSVADLVRSGAPIDGFGVGTRLAVAADVPHVDMAYKLVEYAGRPRVKLSSHKTLYPGRKQVYRQSADDSLVGDIVGRPEEKCQGEPLLQPVMRGGVRLAAGRATLEDARRHARQERDRLPDALRRLDPASPPFPVKISDMLKNDLEALRQTLLGQGA
jgi:nicotinate phosphoribosyltransferase